MLENQPKYDVGIIGDGQLGRMLTEAAIPMGLSVGVIGPSEGLSPAALVGAEQVKVARVDDYQATLELAKISAVTTIEIEHVNAFAFGEAESNGHQVLPSAESIALLQDKLKQKDWLRTLGIPITPFQELKDEVDALRYFSGKEKFILKRRMGGFDGRGNRIISNEKELFLAWRDLSSGGSQLYAEEIAPFKKEIAIQVARSVSGDAASYDVVESIQDKGICDLVYTPTSRTVSDRTISQATEIGEAIVKGLGTAGLFAVEMFVLRDGQVVVNEIAPRVHNSGHYTIDANETSQFKQHLLAVTGQPLGNPDRIYPHAAMANILYEVNQDRLEIVGSIPGISVNMYGKDARKGVPRKIGHITAVGNDQERVIKLAKSAREYVLLES